MTSNSNLKKTIRARQADTGETYTEARRHVTAGRRNRAVGPWADADLNEFSPLAGARRAAADGVPVFILDNGSDNATYREVERYDPVVFDDDDFAKMDFQPWEVLQDPKRAAKALARLLHTTVLTKADREKRTSNEAVLIAAASGGSRPPLRRALDLVGADPALVKLYFAERGAECFAQAGAPIPLMAARQPIVFRGSLGVLPSALPLTEVDFEMLKRERIIDVLTEMHAEIDGTSPAYALVFDGSRWYSVVAGAVDIGTYPLDGSLTFPSRDVQATSAELFAGYEGGSFRWSDLEGGPVVITGSKYRRRSQLLRRVTDAAIADGCASIVYLKPGDEYARTDTVQSAEDFEAALIRIVTERLVEGRTDRHQVIAIGDLESLTEKVEVSPRPAPTLPTPIRQKIYERIAVELRHNDRADAILSLIDTVVRRDSELNLTVIISTKATGLQTKRDVAALGGAAPWDRASTLQLWGGEEALRGSVNTPTRDHSVQFYV